MESKALIKVNNIKYIIEFLQKPSIKIAEALTGILTSSVNDWKLSAGRLVQSSIKFQLFTQLRRELQEYIKKGTIKEDYYATNLNKVSLNELLKFIDEEAPDEERFKAMKSIFFTSVEKSASDKDQALAYELMQICKKLTSGDILILKAAFDIVNSKLAPNMPTVNHRISNANDWLALIAQQIGHNISALVEVHEESLIKFKLITDRTNSDRSGISSTSYFRLTPLGQKLCEFISNYE